VPIAALGSIVEDSIVRTPPWVLVIWTLTYIVEPSELYDADPLASTRKITTGVVSTSNAFRR
jgi:hypothetical protein